MRGIRLKFSEFEMKILMALLEQHSKSKLSNVSNACLSIKEQIERKTREKFSVPEKTGKAQMSIIKRGAV